jgi:zinc/manganese transport system ATP-binding protein
MGNIVNLENIVVKYGKRVALNDISGSFKKGSLTALAGPNGAGKSTLLKLIAGILKPASGKVSIDKDAIKNMAYLPQTSRVAQDFPMTVLDAVVTGFVSQTGLHHRITENMRGRAVKALADVGLASFGERQLHELSGGQFQRMLFARVIIQNADLILLDEPFTAVDAQTTAKLIEIMLGWHRQGCTIICVLHDLLLIQKYFPDSFVLAGKCLGKGHTHAMFEQKLLSFDLDMAELCAGGDGSHDHTAHEHAARHDGGEKHV